MDNEAPPDLSAGFWLRAGAYMIDGIVLAFVSVILDLIVGVSAVSVVVQFLLWAAYCTVMPVRAQGQTLGKMAAGVAIVRGDGSPLTYGRAFARWLGYLLAGLTFYIGFLCAAFTDRRRALQDYVADTRVIRVKELGPARKFAVVLMGALLPPLIAIALGLVATLALPPSPDLKGSADPQGRLGMLRSAAAIYYGDAEGNYPADLNALVPKQIPEIAPAGVPAHPGAAGVEVYGPEVCSGSKEPGAELVAAKLRDTGKWGYVVAPKAPCDGRIFIDCTHADSKGSAWYTY
jgi:uncharacterized RDD family membrane protein YckC